MRDSAALDKLRIPYRAGTFVVPAVTTRPRSWRVGTSARSCRPRAGPRRRVFRCGWLGSWSERPEGPVHRRQRDHQLGLLAAGRRARHRAVTCSTAGPASTGPLPAGGAGAARRRPRPGVGPRARSAAWSSTRWSTGSRSPPSTCGPTSTCSAGRTGQYVFISSASAYQTPPARLPITESTPLRNPFWQYSRDKIACEDLLLRGLPRATASPSRSCGPRTPTTGRWCPFDGGWTALDRMRQGKPIIVHGDGTSLWTLTHHVDFARGFVGLLGHPRDRRRGLPHHLRRRADLEPDRRTPSRRPPASQARIVHVPSDAIAAADPDMGRRPARRQGALDGLRQHQAAHASCRVTAPRSRSSRARARSSPGTTKTLPAAGRRAPRRANGQARRGLPPSPGLIATAHQRIRLHMRSCRCQPLAGAPLLCGEPCPWTLVG